MSKLILTLWFNRLYFTQKIAQTFTNKTNHALILISIKHKDLQTDSQSDNSKDAANTCINDFRSHDRYTQGECGGWNSRRFRINRVETIYFTNMPSKESTLSHPYLQAVQAVTDLDREIDIQPWARSVHDVIPIPLPVITSTSQGWEGRVYRFTA